MVGVVDAVAVGLGVAVGLAVAAGVRVAVGVALLGCATAEKGATVPRPPVEDRDDDAWARGTLRQLSLEEKVGQLFMIWVRAQFRFSSRSARKKTSKASSIS